MARANPPPSAAKRTPPHTPILTPVEAPADTPASSGIPLASYVLAGSTLLGFGAYAYFGLSGLAKERKYQRLEDPEMCDFCSSGERDYVLANIGLGVGLASAVGAVAVFFLSRPDQKPVDQRAGLQVLPAGLQWSERF